jgi:hypothetical protein
MVLPEKKFSTSAIAAEAAFADRLTVTLGTVQFSVVVTANVAQPGSPEQA